MIDIFLLLLKIYAEDSFKGYLVHQGKEAEYLTSDLGFSNAIKKAVEVKLIKVSNDKFVIVRNKGKILGFNNVKSNNDDAIGLAWFTQKRDLFKDSSNAEVHDPSYLFELEEQKDKTFGIKLNGSQFIKDKNAELKIALNKELKPLFFNLVTEDGEKIIVKLKDEDEDKEDDKEDQEDKTVTDKNKFVLIEDFEKAELKTKNKIDEIETRLDLLEKKIKEGELLVEKLNKMEQKLNNSGKSSKHKRSANTHRKKKKCENSTSSVSSDSKESDVDSNSHYNKKSHRKKSNRNCDHTSPISNEDIKKQLETMNCLLKAMPLQTQPTQQIIPMPIFGPVPYHKHRR